MNGETVYAATDYLRPFPDAHDVFSRDVEEHSEYLLPVASLSLAKLSPDWKGEIHFIIPIEPVGGYGVLGERSMPYHNYLCRPNWLGYKMHGDKCELACDFRYFHKSFYKDHPPESIYQDELAQLPDHYAQVRMRFQAVAQHFQKHGWLCTNPEKWDSSQPEPQPGDLGRAALVQDLGGVSYDSNWLAFEFPVSTYPDEVEDRGERYELDRVLPQTEDGRDFTYLGRIDMWDYIGDTNGSLLLFCDPEQQIALTTIDWS